VDTGSASPRYVSWNDDDADDQSPGIVKARLF